MYIYIYIYIYIYMNSISFFKIHFFVDFIGFTSIQDLFKITVDNSC